MIIRDGTVSEPETVEMHDESPEFETAGNGVEVTPEPPAAMIQQTEPHDISNDLDDLLSFEVEEDPESFFNRSANETTSGTFIPFVKPIPSVSDDEDGDWKLDLSPAQITGESINSDVTVPQDQGAENDFLKVRNHGRQSARRAVAQTGTRLSVDSEVCMTWAEETLAKGCFSFEDVDVLIDLCEGNGDPEELRINIQRNLEAAGLNFVDQSHEHDVGLWDAKSDISLDELAEAIEAVLTRTTRLPGTRRFRMNKSDELQLLEPMVQTKQKLYLSILTCEAAVEIIIDAMERIRDGSRDSSSVSLRPIFPARPDHSETMEVFEATDTLNFWHTNGRVMDGKRRREALTALETLDLSPEFHKEIIRSLEQVQANFEETNHLISLISAFEAATEHLICEHLPYARRFVARNMEEDEDFEDVFQVAFTGLQRSTRRFDSERGVRFVTYCTFWMRQAVWRWRADEGTMVRVPVHRHENLAKFDRAMDNLNIRAEGIVSDNDLATKLGWTTEEVRQFREIPREAEYPESIEAWDAVFPEPENDNYFDHAEIERIVTDILAELQERQAEVIRMRFGIGRNVDMTLEEIGQLFGVTRERIRQIEASGLKHLSHPPRKRRLRALLGM